MNPIFYFNVGLSRSTKTNPTHMKHLQSPGVPKNSGNTSNDMDASAKNLQNLDNTLGAVAKAFSKAGTGVGMLVKGLGKTTGGAAMGIAGATQGFFGLLGAGLAYGGTRLLFQGHKTALKTAAKGGEYTGLVAAGAISSLLFPISLTAKCIEGMGKILMKPGKKDVPKAYKKFDESFQTHIIGSLGRVGKNKASIYSVVEKQFEKRGDKKEQNPS